MARSNSNSSNEPKFPSQNFHILFTALKLLSKDLSACPSFWNKAALTCNYLPVHQYNACTAPHTLSNALLCPLIHATFCTGTAKMKLAGRSLDVPGRASCCCRCFHQHVFQTAKEAAASSSCAPIHAIPTSQEFGQSGWKNTPQFMLANPS